MRISDWSSDVCSSDLRRYSPYPATMPGKGVLRMANWSDPRQSAAPYRTAAGIQTEAYDAGLRSYMLSVYNYMTSGVLLTGIIAMLFARGGVDSPAANIIMNGGPLAWVIMLAPLGFVFAMSFGPAGMKASTLQIMFWGFAVTMGLALSLVFLPYSGTTIAPRSSWG